MSWKRSFGHKQIEDAMTIDTTNMCSHLQRKLFEEDGIYHPLWLAEHEVGHAGHLAVRHEGEVEAITTRLSEHIHECAMVLRGRHLDMAHPCFLRSHFLHHHHWHTIREDALPSGKTGLVTIWQRTRIV